MSEEGTDRASGPNGHCAQVSWRDVLPVHPAAELFPLMSKDELREFADDIQKHGLRDKIEIYKDSVLDGRNRLDALELINWPWEDFLFVCPEREPGFDPYAFVISKNIHRRHLTVDQKKDIVAKLLKAKPETSNIQIAKQVKVSDHTVAKVRAGLESTSHIAKLEKTVGKDGKERPAHKPKPAEQLPREPMEEHVIPKKQLWALNDSWREVYDVMWAGGLTEIKAALGAHRDNIDRVLEGLAP